jgi:hypothetical protein
MAKVFRRIAIEMLKALAFTILGTSALYALSRFLTQFLDDNIIVINWTVNNSSALIMLTIILVDAFHSMYAAVDDGNEDYIWLASEHFRSSFGRWILALVLWVAGIVAQFTNAEGTTIVLILSIAPIALQANVFMDFLSIRKKLKYTHSAKGVEQHGRS